MFGRLGLLVGRRVRGHGEDGAVGAQHGHRNTSEHDPAPRRPSGANDEERGRTLGGEPGERIGDRPRASDGPSNVQNYRLDRGGVGALAGDVCVGTVTAISSRPGTGAPRRRARGARRPTRRSDHDRTRCGGLALLGEERVRHDQ